MLGPDLPVWQEDEVGCLSENDFYSRVLVFRPQGHAEDRKESVSARHPQAYRPDGRWWVRAHGVRLASPQRLLLYALKSTLIPSFKSFDSSAVACSFDNKCLALEMKY